MLFALFALLAFVLLELDAWVSEAAGEDVWTAVKRSPRGRASDLHRSPVGNNNPVATG